jgi:hypothetical protein
MSFESSDSVEDAESSSVREHIEQLERQFLALGDSVAAKIDHHVQDPWLREVVLMPFELVRCNQQNPRRSFDDFCRAQTSNAECLKQVITRPHALCCMPMTKSGQFFYRYVPDATSRSHANFRGSCRLITQHRNLDTPAGQSMLYHELVHAAIDNTERSTLLSLADWERYLQWEYSDSPLPKADVRSPDECWANGLQIELLNILSDGRLAAGIDRKDYEEFAREVDATDEHQIGTIMMLAHLSTGYFQNRPTHGNGCCDVFIKFYIDCMQYAERSVHDYDNHTPSAHVYSQSKYATQLAIPGFVLLQAMEQK